MNRWIVFLSAATALGIVGCNKPQTDPGMDGGTVSSDNSQGGGITTVGPDVGGVTPVTGGPTLDSAAGGGVNSAAMKKAKGIAAGGVGSVNNAQRQGTYGGEDGG